VKAIILAAGFGTRLGSVGKETPKALLEIRGKPLLAHLLKSLQRFSLSEILVVTNQKFESEFQNSLDREKPGSRIPLTLYSNGITQEASRLGTLGDLWRVMEKYELSEPVLVLLGDNFFSFDLHDFMSSVRKRPFDPWLLAYELKRKEEASRYGVISLDGDFRIKAFQEKPAAPKSRLISTGVYYFPSYFLWDELSLYRRIFPEKQDRMGDFLAWSVENFRVLAHVVKGGFWFDIGDLESLKYANLVSPKTGGRNA